MAATSLNINERPKVYFAKISAKISTETEILAMPAETESEKTSF
jgi:hypothetical protein